jgi:predicted porin
MQKKLIALAVAGLASSAAFAQSNVTIYGIVDVAYTHSSSGSSKTSGIDSGGWSSSRIGFRGTEDLGDGMKALFTLEYGLSPDVNSGVGVTATGGGSARQTWIGLQNSSGSIKVGRQNTLGKNSTDKYDPLASGTFSVLYALQRGNGVGSQSVAAQGSAQPYALQTVNGRFSNAVTVESAKMSGFVLSFQYAFNGQDGLDANPKGGAVVEKQSDMAFSVDYSEGPLALNFTHQRARDVLDIAGNKATENWVSGAYDFGAAKVMASYQTTARTQTGVSFDTDKLWSAGVQIPVTKMSKVYFGYASADDAAATDNDVTAWGMAYTHDLSKRTMLYGGYQRVSNTKLATISVLPNTGGRAAVAAGANATGWGFGVRHTF